MPAPPLGTSGFKPSCVKGFCAGCCVVTGVVFSACSILGDADEGAGEGAEGVFSVDCGVDELAGDVLAPPPPPSFASRRMRI
jgi:hypothetical protein